MKVVLLRLGVCLDEQRLDLGLLGGVQVGHAVRSAALLRGAVLEQHAHAFRVSLPDGGQQRSDAMLVDLLCVHMYIMLHI